MWMLTSQNKKIQIFRKSEAKKASYQPWSFVYWIVYAPRKHWHMVKRVINLQMRLKKSSSITGTTWGNLKYLMVLLNTYNQVIHL